MGSFAYKSNESDNIKDGNSYIWTPNNSIVTNDTSSPDPNISLEHIQDRFYNYFYYKKPIPVSVLQNGIIWKAVFHTNDMSEQLSGRILNNHRWSTSNGALGGGFVDASGASQFIAADDNIFNAYTIATWVKFDSDLNDVPIFEIRDSESNTFIKMDRQAVTVAGPFGDVSKYYIWLYKLDTFAITNSNDDFSANQDWQLIIWRHSNNNKYNLYINGVIANTHDHMPDPINPTLPSISIGSADVKMTYFICWNRYLSNRECATLWNKGQGFLI